jgi:hypothetical protein
MLESFWLAEELAAPKEGVGCMEIVGYLMTLSVTQAI